MDEGKTQSPKPRSRRSSLFFRGRSEDRDRKPSTASTLAIDAPGNFQYIKARHRNSADLTTKEREMERPKEIRAKEWPQSPVSESRRKMLLNMHLNPSVRSGRGLDDPPPPRSPSRERKLRRENSKRDLAQEARLGTGNSVASTTTLGGLQGSRNGSSHGHGTGNAFATGPYSPRSNNDLREETDSEARRYFDGPSANYDGSRFHEETPLSHSPRSQIPGSARAGAYIWS
jgi:hypothetical protein